MEWVGSTTGGGGYGGNYPPPSVGSGYGGSSTYPPPYGAPEDEDQPLLEELGIDIPAILRRTKAVLFFKLNSQDLEEFDMGGPLIFALLMGSLHLLMGKLHFGVILGWSSVGSCIVWLVVNKVAGASHDHQQSRQLGLYNVMCLLGYSMLPMVVFSAVAMLIPRGLAAGIASLAAAVWSASIASKLFAKQNPTLDQDRLLVSYPCLLMYAAFALLATY